MGCQFLYKGELEPVPKTSAEVAAASCTPIGWITDVSLSLNQLPHTSISFCFCLDTRLSVTAHRQLNG